MNFYFYFFRLKAGISEWRSYRRYFLLCNLALPVRLRDLWINQVRLSQIVASPPINVNHPVSIPRVSYIYTCQSEYWLVASKPMASLLGNALAVRSGMSLRFHLVIWLWTACVCKWEKEPDDVSRRRSNRVYRHMLEGLEWFVGEVWVIVIQCCSQIWSLFRFRKGAELSASWQLVWMTTITI